MELLYLALSKTLEIINDGVLFHSVDRKITFFNRAAERIIGIDRDKVIGHDCHEVLPFKLCGGNCSFCDPAAQVTTDIKTYETVIPFENKHKSLKITAMPIVEKGKLQLVIVSFFEKGAVQTNKKSRKRKSFCGIIGQHDKMLQLYETILEVAHSDAPVAIWGESGTGKEIVAKAIHTNSKRRQKPFIAINCGAFAQGIIDSELFGHVKGAFTGAVKDKKGCFERANGGTLFLDEVAELPKETQVKLLRVLQEGTFEPVGGEETKKVDLQIISATNRNLKYMLENNEFREDLYYRLAVFPIMLPPLRDRVKDIPLLVEHFIEDFSKKLSFPQAAIDLEALDLLQSYRWPGNARQLQNAIHYALIKCKGSTIGVRHLPPELTHAIPVDKVKRIGRKQKLNIDDVVETLKEVDGNKAKCAKILGVSRATLYNFIKRENVDLG